MESGIDGLSITQGPVQKKSSKTDNVQPQEHLENQEQLVNQTMNREPALINADRDSQTDLPQQITRPQHVQGEHAQANLQAAEAMRMAIPTAKVVINYGANNGMRYRDPNASHTEKKRVSKARQAELTAYEKDETKKEERQRRDNEHKEYVRRYMNGLAQELDLNEFLNSEYCKQSIFKKKVVGKTTNEDIFQDCLQGNYSQFENLDVMLRNALAINYMHDQYNNMAQGYATAKDMAEGIWQTGGTKEAMNPVFRLGLSMAKKQGGIPGVKFSSPEEVMTVDHIMTHKLMASTMSHFPNDTEKLDMQNKLGSVKAVQEAIEKDNNSKKFLFKTHFMMQLAGVQIHTDDAANPDYSYADEMAVMYSHCSRVAITLPSGKASDRLLDTYLGKKRGRSVGIEKRLGATHRLVRAEKNGDKMAEIKGFSAKGQNCYNMAVGGLGRQGIGGATLLNDGSCGSFYMKLKEGDSSHHTGILLGCESDSFLHTNQQGHTHYFATKNEHSSSFGGQRYDEIGKKYGGRTVDLSGMSDVELTTILSKLDDRISQLIRAGAETTLNDLALKLSGKQMSRDEFDQLATSLGIDSVAHLYDKLRENN